MGVEIDPNSRQDINDRQRIYMKTPIDDLTEVITQDRSINSPRQTWFIFFIVYYVAKARFSLIFRH